MKRREFLFGTAATALALSTLDGHAFYSVTIGRKIKAWGVCDTCGMTWPHKGLRNVGKLLVCDRAYCKAIAAPYVADNPPKGLPELINDVRMEISSRLNPKWVKLEDLENA